MMMGNLVMFRKDSVLNILSEYHRGRHQGRGGNWDLGIPKPSCPHWALQREPKRAGPCKALAKVLPFLAAHRAAESGSCWPCYAEVWISSWCYCHCLKDHCPKPDCEIEPRDPSCEL